MSLPTPAKTWTISPNNRITFVSLLDTMQKYLLGVKNFLKNAGYTVKGSSSNGTAAMDGVDRWTASTDVTPRATTSAASQAWLVLTDANGCDILLDFQGSSDDICRISFSPTGSYAAAGTPTNQPTATDELVLTSAISVINSTASSDRLWNGWVSSDNKCCRFIIARAGTFTGIAWGVELITSTAAGASVSFSPTVWGFGVSPTANAITNVTQIGKARVVISSTQQLITNLIFGAETYQNTTNLGNILPELQGGNDYLIWPLGVASTTGSARGKLGNLIDWWFGRNGGGAMGDTYGTLQLIDIGITHTQGGLWPWDGVTSPALT